jgi:hypothetical protein
MAEILFTNFAHSQLAGSINSSATTLLLETGHGARFPDPSGGDFFYVTLENASLVREIVKVTGRSTDTLTIVRAQDNTTAVSWSAGDTVALRLNAAAIEYMINEVVRRTGATGSAIVPTGDESERDGSPSAGYFRFNTDVSKFEGYNGTSWGSVGGGATGGGSDAVFIENDQTVTVDYVLPSTKNASSTGPIEIEDGVTVTVSSGSRWVVL